MRSIPILLVLCGAAIAQPVDKARDAQAKKFYEAGRDAFAAGNVKLAITAWESALALNPRPSIKFSLGKAYRNLYSVEAKGEQAQRALILLREYVDEVKSGVQRTEALGYIAYLEPVVAKYEQDQKSAAAAIAPPKTELMVNGKVPGAVVRFDDDPDELSIPSSAEVTPGPHKLHVTAIGYIPEDIEVTAIAGRLIVVDSHIKERPAHLTVNARADSTVTVDGKVIGQIPLPPIEVSSGTHVLAVSASGHETWSREFTVVRGQEKTIDVDLHRTTRRQAAIALGIASGGLLLGGVIMNAFALSARSDADDLVEKARSGITPAELAYQHERVDDFDRDITATYVLYGLCSAAFGAGVVLFVYDPPTSTGAFVMPTVTGDSVGLSLEGRF
jgi:hypothetical protein